MNYFFDTEFLEGPQKTLFGHTKPTIDLISIGIVAEDGREYYAVSRDFNLKEAWNRYDIKHVMPSGDMRNSYPNGYDTKVYWIRENVLRPIYWELSQKLSYDDGMTYDEWVKNGHFSYRWMKQLIKKYGKSNKQIAEEIVAFCHDFQGIPKTNTFEFYAYYADYDWVVFCWLFGRMIDLPTGFPWYCNDLKQTLDELVEKKKVEWGYKAKDFDMINHIKTLPDYPEQSNEHHALADARWTKELYNFLINLKP